MLSPVRLLSVVCNVCALYSGGSNFRQYFYGIGSVNLSLKIEFHILHFSEPFTENSTNHWYHHIPDGVHMAYSWHGRSMMSLLVSYGTL